MQSGLPEMFPPFRSAGVAQDLGLEIVVFLWGQTFFAQVEASKRRSGQEEDFESSDGCDLQKFQKSLKEEEVRYLEWLRSSKLKCLVKQV